VPHSRCEFDCPTGYSTRHTCSAWRKPTRRACIRRGRSPDTRQTDKPPRRLAIPWIANHRAHSDLLHVGQLQLPVDCGMDDHPVWLKPAAGTFSPSRILRISTQRCDHRSGHVGFGRSSAGRSSIRVSRDAHETADYHPLVMRRGPAPPSSVCRAVPLAGAAAVRSRIC